MESILRRLAEKVLRMCQLYYAGGRLRSEDYKELSLLVEEASEVLSQVRGAR